MFQSISFTKPLNLINESSAKLRGTKAYLLRKYRAFSRFNIGVLGQWASKFNSSQWCYFIAAGYLLGIAVYSELAEPHFMLAALIAFLGLFREMWRMFQRVWEHNLGKAFVLIVYATTANFALAFAAVKINVVTGVEPTPFTFTLGFTTLVMLPFWITLSNILFLLIGLILTNLLLLISIPCRILGIRLSVHWEDKHRAVTTMMLRTILIPIVIYGLITLTSPYFSQFGFFDNVKTPTQVVTPLLGSDSPDANNQAESSESEFMQEIQSALSEKGIGDAFNLKLSADENEQKEALDKANAIYKLIADFIYYFESYPYSMCKKSEGQHSIIIDEYSVLFMTPDKTAEYGYQFEVSECVPIYAN